MSSWDDDRQYEQDRRALRDYLGWPDPEPEPWFPSLWCILFALAVEACLLGAFIGLGLWLR